MITKTETKTPYETVCVNFDSKGEKPFANVVGHQSQKEEFLLVLDWFKNYNYWKSKKVSLPKGVLLYGEPGNGKSLFMREAIKYVGLPTYIFKGDLENITKGLEQTFNKAKENSPSVVIIDELDLLIDKESRVTRVLQENLDGVESKEDILVIAATNNYWNIPDPLLRPGRLEKIIKIPYPTGQEAFELLKMHFNKMGVSLSNDIDNVEIELVLNKIPCAGIKTIANDIVLRNGFDNIDTQMIIDSVYRATNHIQDKNKTVPYATAVHEAGHAVMANRFSRFFEITRLDIKQDGGLLSVKELNEDYWPYDKMIADIKISMSGVIAEKVLCGVGSLGCESDLQRARKQAWNAINYSGYLSCSYTLPEIKPFSNIREEPEKKKEINTKKADSLLKKCERDTLRFLKKQKRLIKRIADELFAKKFLSSSDVAKIIKRETSKNKFKFYEAMWFFDHGDVKEDWETKSFKTKWGAMKYYQKHKDDEGTYWWKVTKRTYGFEIMETYIDEFKEKI